MKFPSLSTEELRRRVARLPRVDLALLPTPLEEVPRFTESLGGVRIFLKRDDYTGGILFSGNKTRHNEFIMADALRQGADMVVWGAGVQSNNCRQTAAACARLGIECRLFLSRAHSSVEVQGNLLLDYLVGAHVEIVDAPIGPALNELLASKAEEFRRDGRKPYVWDRSTVQPIAAISYALCLAEIMDEMRRRERPIAAVYVSSAGSTGAGLALGKALLGVAFPVRSICPLRWPWDTRADMAKIANDAAMLLGLPHRLTDREIEATDDFIGPGYGLLSQEGWEAMDLLARTESTLLDPIYTAKAMAGLLFDIRNRRIHPGDNVVFIHTGGVPAVFAYRDALVAMHPERFAH